MNILVPYKKQNSIDSFIQAGATEFYMGFHDDKFTHRFGSYVDLNRMTGFEKIANPFSFEECLNQINLINDKGGKAFITLNANTYNHDVISFIAENYLQQFYENNVAGIITSDLSLAKKLREYNLPIIASTMCGIYNSDIAQHFYKNGFHRIIVPRDLSLSEINQIISNLPEAEFEVFFMRNGCVFSDCYCLGTHRSECGATCHFIKNHYKRFMTYQTSFDQKQKIDLNNKLYNEVFHKETCGMCALYRLKEFGVGSLKIVGRSDNPEAIVEDIKLIKSNIQIAEDSKTEQDYLNNMIFPDNRSSKCISGLSCYYPEVRFGKKSQNFENDKIFVN